MKQPFNHPDCVICPKCFGLMATISEQADEEKCSYETTLYCRRCNLQKIFKSYKDEEGTYHFSTLVAFDIIQIPSGVPTDTKDMTGVLKFKAK